MITRRTDASKQYVVVFVILYGVKRLGICDINLVSPRYEFHRGNQHKQYSRTEYNYILMMEDDDAR